MPFPRTAGSSYEQAQIQLCPTLNLCYLFCPDLPVK